MIKLKQLLKESYHNYYPTHRKELTFDKIVKRLKGIKSPYTSSDLFTKITYKPYMELKKFASPQELMDNVYLHGTGGYVDKGLTPGFNIVKKGHEGGGGYGEQYHSISLSKSKNKASNFSGISKSGIVYPVLLKHNAKVAELPEIEDSTELEEKLVELWLQKVDAVKIGDWNTQFSEEEIVILNPYAILKFSGETYPVYQKKKFDNPTIEVFIAIFNAIKNNPPPKQDDLNSFVEIKYND